MDTCPRCGWHEEKEPTQQARLMALRERIERTNVQEVTRKIYERFPPSAREHFSRMPLSTLLSMDEKTLRGYDLISEEIWAMEDVLKEDGLKFMMEKSIMEALGLYKR